jgi:hypothetical protein
MLYLSNDRARCSLAEASAFENVCTATYIAEAAEVGEERERGGEGERERERE